METDLEASEVKNIKLLNIEVNENYIFDSSKMKYYHADKIPLCEITEVIYKYGSPAKRRIINLWFGILGILVGFDAVKHILSVCSGNRYLGLTSLVFLIIKFVLGFVGCYLLYNVLVPKHYLHIIGKEFREKLIFSAPVYEDELADFLTRLQIKIPGCTTMLTLKKRTDCQPFYFKKKIAIYLIVVQVLTAIWVYNCPRYEIHGENQTRGYDVVKEKTGTYTRRNMFGGYTSGNHYTKRRRYKNFEHISVPHLCVGIFLIYMSVLAVFLYREDFPAVSAEKEEDVSTADL